MEIADPLVVACIGTLGAAVAVLFRRSEKCLTDRDTQTGRIDDLERAIYGCPIQACPNKPSWKKAETTTLQRLPNTQTTS